MTGTPGNGPVDRERVWNLHQQGLACAAIAQRLGVRHGTVTHLVAILRRERGMFQLPGIGRQIREEQERRHAATAPQSPLDTVQPVRLFRHKPTTLPAPTHEETAAAVAEFLARGGKPTVLPDRYAWGIQAAQSAVPGTLATSWAGAA